MKQVTSSDPVAISVGDLNNDGQSDLAVTNSGTDEIELLINYNNGIFMNRTIFPTGLGSHPQSVTIADFNQDHFLGIAVVNAWTNTMNIFLGLGDGSFATRYVYSTGAASAPNSIVAGDLNRDGRIDVVTANENTHSVGVFLAFDYVAFTDHVIDVPGVRPAPVCVVTGDFNNDHLLDIAICNIGTDNLGIYLGYGNGTFSGQITLSTGLSSSPGFSAVGDFDNDHCLDLVVTDQNAGPISIFLGYGNGSFKEQIVYSMAHQSLPVWVAVDDLNKDKNSDIVFVNGYGNNVCLLFGHGNGSFGNVTVLSTGKDSGPVSVALGDFNRDKSIDIVVANKQSKTIVLFFGCGNGTFLSQKIYSVGPDIIPVSVITSDVNNDTILDILFSGVQIDSNIGILYEFGDGNFTLPKIYPAGSNSQPSMIATGDFNNDSKIDLAISYSNQGSIGVFIQMGNEPFNSPALYSTGTQSHPKSVALGDFNNDHRLDIAVTNSATNTIGVPLGHGNGYFAHPLTYSTGIDSLPTAISVDHFNDDGYLDIAIVNTASGSVSIFLGHRNGSFTQLTTYSTGISSIPLAIAAKDLNKDSHADLVVANQGSNEVLIYLGNGDGRFLPPQTYSVGYNARPQSVAIVDIDNDGTGYVEILLRTC